MPEHYSLKADFYCSFCGSLETYPVMLDKDKVVPSINAKIHGVYLYLGNGDVSLTKHGGVVLICDECKDAINEALKSLRADLKKNLTNTPGV